jgi:hypothetical protein
MHVTADVLGGRVSGERADFEALDAYQSGEMSEAEATTFEEELFANAAAGAAAEAHFVDRLSRIGLYLAGRGGWDFGSSRARVDELIAAGLRVQLLEPEPGLPGEPIRMPKINDDAEIVASWFAIDVRGFDSVRVIVEKPDGTELKTFRDIGFDPTDGSIYAVCEAPLARIWAQQKHLRSRIIGTRAGLDHVVAVVETVTGP